MRPSSTISITSTKWTKKKTEKKKETSLRMSWLARPSWQTTGRLGIWGSSTCVSRVSMRWNWKIQRWLWGSSMTKNTIAPSIMASSHCLLLRIEARLTPTGLLLFLSFAWWPEFRIVSTNSRERKYHRQPLSQRVKRKHKFRNLWEESKNLMTLFPWRTSV